MKIGALIKLLGDLNLDDEVEVQAGPDVDHTRAVTGLWVTVNNVDDGTPKVVLSVPEK